MSVDNFPAFELFCHSLTELSRVQCARYKATIKGVVANGGFIVDFQGYGGQEVIPRESIQPCPQEDGGYKGAEMVVCLRCQAICESHSKHRPARSGAEHTPLSQVLLHQSVVELMKVLQWSRCPSGWQSSQQMTRRHVRRSANLQKRSNQRHDLHGWTFSRSKRLTLGNSLCLGSMENPGTRTEKQERPDVLLCGTNSHELLRAGDDCPVQIVCWSATCYEGHCEIAATSFARQPSDLLSGIQLVGIKTEEHPGQVEGVPKQRALP